MIRVGLGFDSHRFGGAAEAVMLGGVAIPHARKLDGHSDADVLLHALTDALLGAVGAPELGEQFPSSDPAWKGADSRRFVEHSLGVLRAGGWALVNLDAVIVADAPRVAPYKAQVRASLSRLLGVEEAAVSVKAKTSEGFPPGDEGIAAQVVVLVERVARQVASA